MFIGQPDLAAPAAPTSSVETGLIVQVPLFVGPGDRVKVDTRTGDYLSRA